MAKYKLHITFEFDTDETDAQLCAGIILRDETLNRHGYPDPKVSLIREGDRSGANLLNKINDRHYSHQKMTLNEWLAKDKE